MSDFWSGAFGNSPVIQPTRGEQLPPPQNTPYDNPLGGAVGLDPSINNAGAQAVFPVLSPDPDSPDSLIAKAGKPAHFDDPPFALTANIFASWHSAYQAEYINSRRKKGEGDEMGILTIGTGNDAIHVMLSGDQTKVYILEALQKADFATMTMADQTRISSEAAADMDGTGAAAKTLVRLGMTAKVDEASSAIDDLKTAIGKDTSVSSADKQVFLDELANVQKRVDATKVYSVTNINSEVSAISDRFHRVAVFAKAKAAGPLVPDPSDPNQFRNVTGLNLDDDGNNLDILNGLKGFMNAEKQILAADNAAMQIANTGTLVGLTKHLDAPNLLAAFQLSANLKDQAINAADTEEINQINQLLKTYNVIQELINQTIATFDASKSDEKRGLLGYDEHGDTGNNSGFGPGTDKAHTGINKLQSPIEVDGDDDDKSKFTPPALSDAQLKAVSMFEKDLNSTLSPIEELLGVTRPSGLDFYDNAGKTLNYFQKSTWDQWSAILSNTVQQISQENQLKFNDINTLEKERTTHFQAATNALTKAGDIIASIGRNIS
ncbi:hypothetical protein XH83_13115 [Bradyrhizobium sp. CCBAU 53351]|uniref:hypothetical protein n=1 Tax=Bradyrhizobium sp. CCBAU 53351 TaxID=1325114 RepID=UPI0018873861|nr:hypothetical protein [Bradyrhizobium sp. CCBAU 53351]QOZ76302.1 hypothetical protein XH83_13115 [Bradyrhizobium sp. CCBAU 53351]